jgi:hypothetical protein
MAVSATFYPISQGETTASNPDEPVDNRIKIGEVLAPKRRPRP